MQKTSDTQGDGGERREPNRAGAAREDRLFMGVSLPTELARRVKIVAAVRGIPVRAAHHEALRLWLRVYDGEEGIGEN